MKEHISYGPLVQKLMKQFNPQHSTRQLATESRHLPTSPAAGSWTTSRACCPKSLDVVIKKGSWDMLPIFQIIAEKSGVPDEELYQVFNMGIGMVAIVSADQADAALKFIRAQKHQAWIIGEVVKGKGEARVV